MLPRIVLKTNSTLLSCIAKFADLFWYCASALLAFHHQFFTFSLPFFYRIAILIACLLIIPVFSFFDVYSSLRGKSLWHQVKMILPAFIALMIVLASLAFITKTGELFSRAWFLWWHLYALLSLVIFRIVLYTTLKFMRKHGFNHKRIIILGPSASAEELAKRVNETTWAGFDLVAIFANETEQNKAPANLSRYIETKHIDEVWLIAASENAAKLAKTLQMLQLNVVTVRYFPLILATNLLNQSVSEVLGLPVVNIISSPMTDTNRFIKAIEDRLLSLIILLLISPILIGIACLVKLSSPGPIFFRQERVSWNGKIFNMLKFRSMPIDAEANTGAVWASVNDNRPTKIGAFLRKTSLDELPQFINVLKGNMSIVGPRPERPVFIEQFKQQIPNYMQKHLVKAGITGWAQVNGWRGNTSLEKRIEYDLYYITHWSLWLDLKIIFLTIFKGFIHKNAY